MRYKTSFISRFIQSGERAKEFYNVIKNLLLSYKGVKARASVALESFNKGRTQCAKINIRGNTLYLYLALNPEEYSKSKYHFTDVSNRAKYSRVPMAFRIRSTRMLKNTLALIREMMEKLGVKQGELVEVDYRLPEESTQSLIEKGYIRIILPKGVEIDENTVLEKMNFRDVFTQNK